LSKYGARTLNYTVAKLMGRTMTVGRNDPCPCGSGKKYKRCCLLKEYVPAGREESIKQRLVQDILRFVRKNYRDLLDDALDLFWDDFVPDDYLDRAGLEMAEINFWEWVVFDWQPLDDRKSTIDLFLKANKNLTQDETSVLIMMNDAVISLYEVQEVFPEKGLLLKDLVLGGEYEVSEKSATRSLSKWDILAARVLKVDGKHILSGCVYGYPRMQKENILAMIKEGYRGYKLDDPRLTMKRHLKENSEDFNYYWYDLFQNPRIPNLFTTTGEPVLFCKAVYDIMDRDAVISSLKAIREFRQEEDGNFVWVDKPDEDQSTILGTIVIKERRFRLECNSKERLERGKKLIHDALSEVVAHRADEYSDPAQAMKSLKERPAKPISEIPLEVQQEFYAQYMQKYYENWLNDKIPALKGKTPMKAIKTKKGREQVIELLKGIENLEEGHRRSGEPWFDISWMWERLGLRQDN
jgi:hypothetical protein